MIPYFFLSPYERIGPVSLGADRDTIRNLFEGEYFSNEREENYQSLGIDVNAFDYFPDEGIKVEYNKEGQCCFIELDRRINIVFKDILLFLKSYEELFEWFSEIDSDVKEDDAGFTSLKYGVSIYAPDHEIFPANRPELISIFERGYYDELIEEGVI